MEAAISAVEFLGPKDNPTASQKAGALLALSSLGQTNFALALLRRLWENCEVDTATAVVLIEQAIADQAHDTQRVASEILRANAANLWTSSGGMFWPNISPSRWPSVTEVAREDLIAS